MKDVDELKDVHCGRLKSFLYSHSMTILLHKVSNLEELKDPVDDDENEVDEGGISVFDINPLSEKDDHT